MTIITDLTKEKEELKKENQILNIKIKELEERIKAKINNNIPNNSQND